jgi:hypothetical protein
MVLSVGFLQSLAQQAREFVLIYDWRAPLEKLFHVEIVKDEDVAQANGRDQEGYEYS